MKVRQANKILKNIILYEKWKVIGRKYKKYQWQKAQKVVGMRGIENFINIYKR